MTFVFGSPRYRHNVASCWFPAGGVQGGPPQLLQEDSFGWFRPKVHAGVRKYMKGQEEKLGQYCLERVLGWAPGGKAGGALALVKWIGYPLDAENATWQPVEGVFTTCKLAWAHLVQLLTPLARAVQALTQLTLARGSKPVELRLAGDFVGGVSDPNPQAHLQCPPLKSVGFQLGEALRNLNVCLQVLGDHPPAHPTQMMPYYAGNSIVGVEGDMEAEAGGVKSYIESSYPAASNDKACLSAATQLLEATLSPLFTYKGGASASKHDKDAAANMMVLWCEGGYRMRELRWAMQWLQAATAPPSREGVRSCMEEWLMEHAVSPAAALGAVEGHSAHRSVTAIGQKLRALRDGWTHRLSHGVTCARRVPLHLCYVTGKDLLKNPVQAGSLAAAVRRTPALVSAAVAKAQSATGMLSRGFSSDLSASAAGLEGSDFASALGLGLGDPPFPPLSNSAGAANTLGGHKRPRAPASSASDSPPPPPRSKPKPKRKKGGSKTGKTAQGSQPGRPETISGDGTPLLVDDDSSGDDLPLASYAAPPPRKAPPPSAALQKKRRATEHNTSTNNSASRVSLQGKSALDTRSGSGSSACLASLRVPPPLLTGAGVGATPAPGSARTLSPFHTTPPPSSAGSTPKGRPAVAGLAGLHEAQAPLAPLGFGVIPMKQTVVEAIAKQWEAGSDTTAAQLSARVSAEAAVVARRLRGRPLPSVWDGPKEQDDPCQLPGSTGTKSANESTLENFADFDVALGRKHVAGGGLGALSDAHEGTVLEAEVRTGKQRFARVVLDEPSKVPKCASAAHVLAPADSQDRLWRVHNLIAARGAVHLTGQAAALPTQSETQPVSWSQVLNWTHGWSAVGPQSTHSARNCSFLVDTAPCAPAELHGGAVDSSEDWTQGTYAHSQRIKLQWTDVAEDCIKCHASLGTTFFAGHDTLRMDLPALIRQADSAQGGGPMAAWEPLLPAWVHVKQTGASRGGAGIGPKQPAPRHPPPPPPLAAPTQQDAVPRRGYDGPPAAAMQQPALDASRSWTAGPWRREDPPSARRWS